MLIFEHSAKGRNGAPQSPVEKASVAAIPENLLRKNSAALPEVSELQAVRHYTRLSRKNFSIDTEFYPLGSCTMKYNPRACNTLAMLPGFLNAHPLTPDKQNQGFLACMYDLQSMLCEATGMAAFSLAPMAGAQGEFAGVAMIEAYHKSRGDFARKEMLIPDAAHGTNPATAVMCGFTVREIPTLDNGDVDIEALKQAVGPQTAGLMLTNPSTLGVFERNIEAIAKVIHEAGGLLYYDGANLNAILGKIRPGDMGFDVIHSNLHKTFSTPHGGGGPGSGAVGVAERLIPFLPLPIVAKQVAKEVTTEVTLEKGSYRYSYRYPYHYLTAKDCPQSIGRLSAFMGNPGVLLRAFIYMRFLGREGMVRVAEFATLNANYMMAEAKRRGFTLAIDQRRASHEFIITLKNEARDFHVSAMDFAKRLLDLGYHAPTTYFPLLVPECLLIEPTESEAKEALDGFMDALEQIKKEAETNPELLHAAPQTLPVKRLDEVRAAKQLDLAFNSTASLASCKIPSIHGHKSSEQ